MEDMTQLQNMIKEIQEQNEQNRKKQEKVLRREYT